MSNQQQEVRKVLGSAVAVGADVVAWYRRSSFWGPAAAGALIWQALRAACYLAFGWHA